jgi:predicted nucleic acid-binding protein
VIYVDSSVMLAELFAEERRVASSFWQQDLVSSRLLEYEVWNRIHVRKLAHIVGDRARLLFRYVSFYEMSPVVLARALTPFPVPLRTLDAMHVASFAYACGQFSAVELASYDKNMVAAAHALGLAVHDLKSSL